MTQQDDWRPEMARLTQRQDRLERQQMDSTRKVEALQRDANALKRDVDRRLDSLRGETDRQFRDRDWRVSSLERSRDAAQNLFWFSIPLVAAAAMIIILVIAVIVSREQSQGPGEPQQRSPSSSGAPLAGSGGPMPPGLADAGTPFRRHHRRPDDRGRGARVLVVDDGEIEDDLVRDATEVMTSLCAQLYGKRSARRRAERAVAATQDDS